MPTAKEKEDLARIRDNQRRSRATRKAYLQELEAKYRKCEQHGMEASAEIQAAARKVLEENKRLRALLKRSGVSDAEIDGFQHAQGESLGYDSSPERTLDTMLGLRRPCTKSTIQLDVKAPIPPETADHSSLLAPQPLPQASFTTPSTTSIPSLRPALPAPSGHLTPNLQYAASEHPEREHDTHAQHQHQQQHQPHHQTYHYQSMQTAPDWSHHNNDQYDIMQQYPANEDPDTRNYSSCVDAANIIRSMRSDVGVELEADLGCKSLGQDCRVNNAVVFEVMDRYSGPSEQT